MTQPHLTEGRVLVLPLKAEYFHAIREGRKPLEYRLRTPYWTKRLVGRVYDRMVLTLGYPSASDESRRLVLPYRGYFETRIEHPFFGLASVDVFAIHCQKD